MANIDYSDLLGEVLPYLAGEPSDPVTQGAIRRAVIDFCTRTRLWKHMPSPIDVAAGMSAYDITAPADAAIVAALDVCFDGVPLVPTSFANLNATKPGWFNDPGPPRQYTQIEPSRILLASVPTGNLVDGLVVTVALAPSVTSTGAPDWLMTQYRYALAEGAIAHLMLMPGKPWTDIQGAIDRRARFDEHIGNARAVGEVGAQAGVIRTTTQH